MFIICIVIVAEQVNGQHTVGFFFLLSSSSVLHNSVGGGTARSARDHLIKFLLLQTHIHVHAVMLTQEAYAKLMTNPATWMNGSAVITPAIENTLWCGLFKKAFSHNCLHIVC